jgi:hypothetical protein
MKSAGGVGAQTQRHQRNNGGRACSRGARNGGGGSDGMVSSGVKQHQRINGNIDGVSASARRARRGLLALHQNARLQRRNGGRFSINES